MQATLMKPLQIFAIVLLVGVWCATASAGMLEDRVHETILDNGLRVLVVERHSAPVFFSLITFRVGSCQELPNHTGLSHFLEHMLFKGTKNVGTTNYKKEAPIMAKLEDVAGRMKTLQQSMEPWRFDKFDEFANQVKAALPDSVRNQIGSDVAAAWRATLERLPSDTSTLPEEWLQTPWLIADRDRSYWQDFLGIVNLRAQLWELMAEQKQYITAGEPLDAIYDVHGSAMHNAFTSPDMTAYMVGLPSNCLELFMYLESDRFQDPVFREFYTERDVVAEELRMGENEPDEVLYDTYVSAVFQGHPYGRPVVGWLSDIQTTLRTDMEAHFWRYYTPNNCQITIVGDVDSEQVFKLARRYFDSWKPGTPSSEVTMVQPDQKGEQRLVVEFDAEPQVMIGYHTPVMPNPDAYTLEMLDNILSSGRTSRFYRNIFAGKGLTAGSPWTSTMPSDRYPNEFTVGAVPKAPHTAGEVETAIYEELERLKTEPVSDRELERVKNRYKFWELGRLRSNQALAFTLSGAFGIRGDWRTVEENFNRLMAITPQDIQRVAQKYFTPENRTVVTLVKKEKPPTENATMPEMEE